MRKLYKIRQIRSSENLEGAIFSFLSSLVVKIYDLPRSRIFSFLSFRFSLTALSFTSRFSSRSSLRQSLTSPAEMPRGKSFTMRRRKQKTSDFSPRHLSLCLVVYRAVTRNRSRREKSREGSREIRGNAQKRETHA